MVEMKYPDSFVAEVHALYPDNELLRDAVSLDCLVIGHFLRSAPEDSCIPPEKLLAARDSKGSVKAFIELCEEAEISARRRALFARWQELGRSWLPELADSSLFE